MRIKAMKTAATCLVTLLAAVPLCSCAWARPRVEIRPGRDPFVSWDNLAETLGRDPKARNEKDSFGQTWLHAAARRGRVDVMELLLAHGARIDARDRWGWTPLAAAVQSDEMEAAKLLIAKGADINAQNNDGWTALNLAALLGNSEIVKFLLDNGADVSAPNRRGDMPLHTAMKYWHKELFVYLWKNGADPDARGAEGMTPREAVERRGFEWKKLFLDNTGVLPQKWVFRTDEDEVGEAQKWHLLKLPNKDWRPISTETFWTHQEYPGMWHGTGWYRIDFTVEETGLDPEMLEASSKVLIAFGAIDGHPKVWLNGALVGQHTGTLSATWDMPWDVDVTEVVKAEGVNELAVSCTKKMYAAGIHPGRDKKPVRLVLETRTSAVQDTGQIGVE